ncbi:MAG: hypothetical protein IT452_21890 [Planctomycetia bacterium]|nr:hypothetical protein [Planctomycetia bacterium]
MRRGERGAAGGLVLALFLAAIAVAVVALWFWRGWLPPQASEQARGVDRVISYIAAAAGLILVGGHFVLARFVLASRREGGPAYRPAGRRAELLLSVIPVAVMVAVTEVGTMVLGAPVWKDVHTRQPGDLEVEITGMQYEWLARYPGGDGQWGRRDIEEFDGAINPLALDPRDRAGKDDIVSRGVIVLPAGRGVWFSIRSWDVLHGFNVPAFRLKQDAVPGMVTHLRLVPSAPTPPGAPLEVACAELCSSGHYRMKAKVIVLSPEDYAKWLETAPRFGD